MLDIVCRRTVEPKFSDICSQHRMCLYPFTLLVLGVRASPLCDCCVAGLCHSVSFVQVSAHPNALKAGSGLSAEWDFASECSETSEIAFFLTAYTPVWESQKITACSKPAS